MHVVQNLFRYMLPKIIEKEFRLTEALQKTKWCNVFGTQCVYMSVTVHHKSQGRPKQFFGGGGGRTPSILIFRVSGQPRYRQC